MSRKKTLFEESLIKNNNSYRYYLDLLTELSISSFEWIGLPDTVDARYIELQLFMEGCAVYFNDEVIGNLALSCVPQGNFNVYGEPIKRRAYSNYNHYQKNLNENDSVLIWNNLTRSPSYYNCFMFANRLWNLDRIIDVNANAQKTPVLVQASEKQRLTMLNLYKEFDGNQPFIFGDKNLDLNSIKAISTQAPYISDKITDLKSSIWNEALTYLGIANVSYQKKERMVSDEVTRMMGGVIANRNSRLKARQVAAEKINKMFGTNISVEFSDVSYKNESAGDDDE